MKMPTIKVVQCEDEDCERCEYIMHYACTFCECKIDATLPAYHILFFDGWGESMVSGDVCASCVVIPPEGLVGMLQDRAGEYEKRAEVEDQKETALTVHIEQLKSHLKWLEGERIVARQRRGAFTGTAIHLNTLGYADTDWEPIYRNEGLSVREERQGPLRATLSRSGFVYLIKSESGHYKIGRTRHVPTRFNTLKIQLPFNIELLHYFPTPDAVKSEREIHDRFRHCRANGEWFYLSLADVQWLKSLTEHKPGDFE